VREEATTGMTTLCNDMLHHSRSFSDIARLIKDKFKMYTSC
jgi:hypothetical protein